MRLGTHVTILKDPGSNPGPHAHPHPGRRPRLPKICGWTGGRQVLLVPQGAPACVPNCAKEPQMEGCGELAGSALISGCSQDRERESQGPLAECPRLGKPAAHSALVSQCL